MDGLKLLAMAHAAGLDARRDGDRVVVQGPREAEALARQLIDHKTEILWWLELREAWQGAKWFSEMNGKDKQFWASGMLDRMDALEIYWELPTHHLTWLERWEAQAPP